MNETAAKTQIVINTLETINIPASYQNVSRMLGVYRTLFEIRDSQEEKAEEAPEDGREADAE